MVEDANCYCAAGETQSCVHVTALLFTLAKIRQLHAPVCHVPGQGHQ